MVHEPAWNHPRPGRVDITPGALQSVTVRAWQKEPGNAAAYQNALQDIAEIASAAMRTARP